MRNHLVIYPEKVADNSTTPTYATAFTWYTQYHESQGDNIDNMFILGRRLKHMQKDSRPINTGQRFKGASVNRKLLRRIKAGKRYEVISIACYGNGRAGLPQLGFSVNVTSGKYISYNRPMEQLVNKLAQVSYNDTKFVFYVTNFAASPRKHGQKRLYDIYNSPAYFVFSGLQQLGREDIEVYARGMNTNKEKRHYLYDPFWLKISEAEGSKYIIPIANRYSDKVYRNLWRNWNNKLKDNKDTLKFRFFDMTKEEIIAECMQ